MSKESHEKTEIIDLVIKLANEDRKMATLPHFSIYHQIQNRISSLLAIAVRVNNYPILRELFLNQDHLQINAIHK